MTSLSFIIHSDGPAPRGFRYLWAKHVKGFNSAQHCARCLVGPYLKPFGLKSPVNEMVELTGYKPGDFIYFCGVSAPYRWERNMHLAVRVTGDPTDTASVTFHNGDELTLAGAVAVPFTDEKARSQHPGLGSAFLTCRNFQFGVAIAEELPA